MNEFDIKAAEWDNNPMHWDRSEAIANELKRMIPINTEMRVLEYGAGTGITSFLLKDYVKEITLMDNSFEMVSVMTGKIILALSVILFGHLIYPDIKRIFKSKRNGASAQKQEDF